MTSSRTNLSTQTHRQAGFTLVEVLIGSTLGALILTGVISSYLLLVKTGLRTSYYSAMETQTRMAFEQLGIDSRMSNGIVSNFSSGAITSFTLTIPDSELTTQRQVTYVYDSSDSADKKLIMVPGSSPTATTGRRTLVSNVTNLTFLRYDGASVLIPASTISDSGVKHIQISIRVSRSTVGVAAATQVIRSSAFTLRNI